MIYIRNYHAAEFTVRWNSTQRFELDMSAREGGTYLGSRIELPTFVVATA